MDTRVGNTQFELGRKPHRRNNKRDWEQCWELAKTGSFDAIDKSVLVPYYGAIRRIAADHATPPAITRKCYVYWGGTGLGKSRDAWDRAGLATYGKDPRSKFWDGYRGQKHVVMDEFRGGIDVAHLLRWTDRYPCMVEIKGSSTPLMMETLWITSNLDPRKWYPELDEETLAALLRRMEITHYESFIQ